MIGVKSLIILMSVYKLVMKVFSIQLLKIFI